MAIMTVKSESESQSFVILWTVDYQASLSMEFSRQEYWIELPIPSPGDLPDPGIELRSPAMQETQVRSLGWEDPLERNGYPLQYSCLENSIDKGAWQATVHWVAKSWI